MALACFKAYDIRGRLGDELNEDIAYRIGRAFVLQTQAKNVAVGSDIRLSSEPLKAALTRGIRESGANVIDLGLTGTEEIYFAASHLDVDGAIEVTASHNPKDYNGMKLVGRNAVPITGNSGLNEIHSLVENNVFSNLIKLGNYSQHSLLSTYVDHLLTYIDLNSLNPMRLVVNAGNGAAGHVIDAIEACFQQQRIPIEFIKIHHHPDGNFPNGIPNPLLPENRATTAEAVQKHRADMGIAWDGDFDRCFLFDEQAHFIEGYYIVGLLAEAFLTRQKGAKIIHDPRLVWNTREIVLQSGGIPIQSKTGHAFIKEQMRLEDAIYGGEMSAHHYFRDFAYCDSGMIPWLLVIELLSRKNKPLSELVGERIDAFPCSGEINYKVDDAQELIARIEHHYHSAALQIDKTDGLSMEMSDWRFNIRSSNTEPLLRLNLETRANPRLVWEKVAELEQIIKG